MGIGFCNLDCNSEVYKLKKYMSMHQQTKILIYQKKIHMHKKPS